MNDKRLAQLSTMLESDPEDTFLQYAIALEYLNGQQFDEAIARFAGLQQQDPGYLATYYQYAMALIQKGEVSSAIEVLEMGIPVAEQSGDRKTANELRMLLEDLDD